MRKTVTLSLAFLVFVGLFSFTHAQSVADLQAELDGLLQQLAALQAELEAQGGAVVPAAPTPLPASTPGTYGQCPSISRALRQGMSGADVTALQEFLAVDPRIYPEGIVSGYFGALTEAAVQKFQVWHGIVSSGNPDLTGYGLVGPKTRAIIAQVCSAGGSVPAGGQTQVPSSAKANCSFSGGLMVSGLVQNFYSVPVAPVGSTCAAYAQLRQCINGVLSGDSRYQYGSCTDSSNACTLDGVTVNNGKTYTFYSRKVVDSNQSCQSYSQIRTCESGILSGSSNYQYATCTLPGVGIGCTLDGVSLQEGQSRTFYRENSVLFGQICTPFGKTRSCVNGALAGDIAYRYATCTVASAATCTVGTTTVAHNLTRDFYSRTSVSYQESCATYKLARTCTDGNISGSPSYQFPLCTQIPAQTCKLDDIEVAHGASHTFYKATVSTPCSGFNCIGQEDDLQGNQGTCASISESRTCTNGVLSGSSLYKYGQCAATGQRWCKLDGVYVQHNTSRTFYTSTSAPFGQSCTQLGQSRKCNDGTMEGSASYAHATCTTAPAASCTLDGQTVEHNQSYGFYSRQSAPSGETCDVYKQTRTCFDGSLTGSSTFQYRTCSNSSASLPQQANYAAALTALESVLQSLLAQWDSLF